MLVTTPHPFPRSTPSPFGQASSRPGIPPDAGVTPLQVGVVGLGYVGLPLLLQFARSEIPALGFDIDKRKIAAIGEGRNYLPHLAADDLPALAQAGRIEATADFSRVSEVNAVIICVPSPLTANREPDLSYIVETAQAIAPHLQRGTLVSLESTTYPGTTDGVLRDALEAGSGLTAGTDFFLAFSPEREDPGNPNSNFAAVPKLVGGLTPACLQRALDVYGRICQVVPCDNARIAEAAKLLENIFRSVNIALVNELKMVYGEMGIDVWKVIEAASSKPYGFMPFYPGPGVGGHCIPIDPFYLSWKAREYEVPSRFIELAGEINWEMPRYVLRIIGDALNARRMAMKGADVCVVGLAYKPDVDDMRESPSLKLMDLLKKRGAQVSYYDPHIPEIPATRAHPQWTGVKSVAWDESVFNRFDAVVIATAHRSVDYGAIGQWCECVIDTRNVMAQVPNRSCSLWKA